jgi:hypothetical protein
VIKDAEAYIDISLSQKYEDKNTTKIVFKLNEHCIRIQLTPAIIPDPSRSIITFPDHSPT